MDEERIYMLYVVFSNFFQNLTIKDKNENLVVHWNERRGANITQNLPVSEEMYLSLVWKLVLPSHNSCSQVSKL